VRLADLIPAAGLLLLGGIGSMLNTLPASAQGVPSCSTPNSVLPNGAFGEASPEQSALAKYWVEAFERLDSAIPSLSPREQQWLEQEMSASDGQRRVRAVGSREYAIRQAKLDSANLLAIVRSLSEGKWRPSARTGWIFLANSLIDQFADQHLERLVRDKVIALEALPRSWSVWADANRVGWVRYGRVGLAQHVLSCTQEWFP
jgi:hypothetical protein